MSPTTASDTRDVTTVPKVPGSWVQSHSESGSTGATHSAFGVPYKRNSGVILVITRGLSSLDGIGHAMRKYALEQRRYSADPSTLPRSGG